MSTKAHRKPVAPPPPAQTASASRVVLVAAVTAVVAGLAGGTIGYLVGSPSASEVAVAEMRQADEVRDKQQVEDLTAMAKSTAEELDKVLAAFVLAVPQDPAAQPQPAVPEIVHGWQDVVRKVAEKHADSPSGMTATNVARGGFRSAVNALSAALDSYAAVLALPEDQRKPLLDLVARQRTTAITMWSVAATQLDQLNVDSGHGHQHAYLTGTPGDGSIPADNIPEGTE
ncbi:hypothetical protein Aph01nite_05030 [Acrocarpospora phusangensis]|uniref:Uncharacterized protein n=1 Tax=Acrocarpospora phusangensis TaxID=1070424 RepID=A0A919Q599_9ACTN|nr:hypothetical protein [Acrocarpospora phusangensis]GIH22193.1 hypothetical protein Aph01nite_05030 [Acrocarpospora phusangensis]